MCLIELAGQSIRSHPKKFPNTVANTGKRCAKHLLLALRVFKGSYKLVRELEKMKKESES